MGAADDPEAFLDLFERTAEIWGWPLGQWAARLIPLLSGEAQLAAQQLPATILLAYGDLKRAILQRVGRTPEESRQLFRSLKFERSDHPFAFAQRLRDTCRRWLLAGDRDVDGVINQVVLEQFTHRLPKGTAEWVQCHRPASLEEAVQFAEDHMATIPRALLHFFSSLCFFPLPSLLPFCSLSRSRSCPTQTRRTSAPEISSPGVGGDTYPYPNAPLLSPSGGGGGGAHRRKCGRSAWAGLLEVRRPESLPRSVPSDGAGDGGAGL
ncbi:zinc finger protein with KRAB and SCAN domains 7-like [Myxocyprinus asiaticus]|uniref:zinc finger protein with KRAB and SCAN domains 7-like n=1 Tax=Myxocyprinus asiaticus TaxID=70543 RepID=UPI0022222539|nr:zinc finger protein with KRAB and SCAN domains 7-like [Myxocyprinus asiaticus]